MNWVGSRVQTLIEFPWVPGGPHVRKGFTAGVQGSHVLRVLLSLLDAASISCFATVITGISAE